MKIAVVGAGGVGGYFGARLAASGEDVWFIARGKHLEAMRKDGLRVLSANGDLTIQSVQATDDPGQVGYADVVMIAVKLWSTEEALSQARPLVGPRTAVVSFQNGVLAADLIGARYGFERTLGGVSNIGAAIEAPGVIRHTGTMAILSFAELDGRRSDRVEALRQACERAKIEVRVPNDIRKAIWEKFVSLVALSSMTCLTRLPVGPIRDDPDTRALTISLMEEVVAVGRAKGVALDADTAAERMGWIDKLPRHMVASMLGDLERGNRLELPWLAGNVVEMGKELGISTPANWFVYTALKLYTNGRPAEARG
ncbi:MAG TPA: 2-dehydropantoate 2-reductase [Burkholderiales bacterium]|nr:2-dehydropantoate 2-reductase [Burkholderiales bacterium]